MSYNLKLNVDIPNNALTDPSILGNLFFDIQMDILRGPLNFKTGEGYLINKWNDIKSLDSQGKFKLSKIEEKE